MLAPLGEPGAGTSTWCEYCGPRVCHRVTTAIHSTGPDISEPMVPVVLHTLLRRRGRLTARWQEKGGRRWTLQTRRYLLQL